MDQPPYRNKTRMKTRKCLGWFRHNKLLKGFAFVSFLIGIGLCLTGVLIRLKKLHLLNELIAIASNEADKTLSSKDVDIRDIFPESYKEIKSRHYSTDVLMGTVSICFIALGAVLTIVSCWGFFIGEKSSVLVLKWYTAIMTFITLALLAFFIFRQQIIIYDMRKTIHDYRGITDTSLAGITWNTMMLGLHCCGVQGIDEFHTLHDWPPGDLEGLTFDREKALRILKIPHDVDNFTAELQKRSCRVTNATGDVSCLWMDTAFFYTPMACCKSMDYIVKGCHLLDTSYVGNNWRMLGCERHVEDYLIKQTHIYVMYAFLMVFITSYSAVMLYKVFDKMKVEKKEMKRRFYRKNPVFSRASDVTLDSLRRLTIRLSANTSTDDIEQLPHHYGRGLLNQTSQQMLQPHSLVSSLQNLGQDGDIVVETRKSQRSSCVESHQGLGSSFGSRLWWS